MARLPMTFFDLKGSHGRSSRMAAFFCQIKCVYVERLISQLDQLPPVYEDMKDKQERLIDLSETMTTTKRAAGLLRLLAGYRLYYAAAILIVGLGALARSGIYYLLAYFIDDVLVSDQMVQLLPRVAAGFVVLAVVRGLFLFMGGRMAARASEEIARRLRNYMYDHILRLSFSYHDRQETGELLQRGTSDVDTVRKLFAEQAIGIGRITLMFIVNFTALAIINLQLALVCVIIVPIVIITSILFFRLASKRFEQMQDQDAKMTNRLQEALSGVRVVKAFARQSFERERFTHEARERRNRGTDLTKIHATYWPSTDILCGLQQVVGYYVGGRMAIAGTLTPGEYIAAMGFVIALIWPIRNLGRFIADSSAAVVSFGRIASVVQVAKEPTDVGIYPDGAPHGRIVFDNVSLAYEGETNSVLDAISFTAEPGQTIALLGSTGSGKSSLVNLLPRFYGYTGGSITLDGIELNQIAPDYLREQIGVVMQEPFLFVATIRDNITYGVDDDIDSKQVIASASAAAVHHVIESFPKGYETLVGEKGVTLSGGQKQRTTIARTLLQSPSILILDDATSAVDTETDAQIRNALNNDEHTCTTFIIAHRIQSVMSADLILVMDNGRIIERGTHSKLMAEGGTYRRIYDVQSEMLVGTQDVAKTQDVASLHFSEAV